MKCTTLKHVEYPPGYLVSERPPDAVDKRTKRLRAGFDTLDAELWAREQPWYPRVIGRSVVRYRAIWWLGAEAIPWRCNACGLRSESESGFHEAWSVAGDADVICEACGSSDTDEDGGDS